MNYLRYIVAGIMVGGAFGAKAGQYISTLLVSESTFQWVEVSMFAGLAIGFIVSVVIMVVLAVDARKEEYTYMSTRKNMTMSGA